MLHPNGFLKRKEIRLIILSMSIIILSQGAIGNSEETFVAVNLEDPGDDVGIIVWPAMNGGYMFTGITRSFGAGDMDAWLVKTDESGTEQWNRTFGGAGQDTGVYFRPTRDRGYIVTGWTNSSGAGGTDVLVIKTDASGTEKWYKTYGGEADDIGRTVHQTRDGGNIIGGMTSSYGIEGRNFILIKTDPLGNELWNKTYGGSGAEVFNTAQPTMGGYVVIGGTNSTIAGDWDIILIRTDENGNELWNKTLSAPGNQTAISFEQNMEGGYTITGITNAADNNDVLLIKTDENGNMLWSETFGGAGDDQGRDILETTDGRYLMAGWTNSSGAGGSDVLLIMTDANGEELWSTTYGKEGDDHGRFVAQTNDGGYIVVGESRSDLGDWDALLVKTDGNGAEKWMNAYGGRNG